LDNVVFRLGFVKTRPQARQLVSHRHVLVNDQKLNIPSYKTRKGETISLDKKALEIPSVKKELENKDKKVPAWLKRKGAVGLVVTEPTFEEVTEPISAQDIIEFYSR
jgi:small subunit ribosomal protein S4